MTIALCCIILLNFIGFLFSYYRQSELLTDLIYALSFVIFILIAYGSSTKSPIQLLIAFMISLWGLRLGYYLFVRIQFMKKDARFDKIRTNKYRLLQFWTLQTLSICILILPYYFIFQKSINSLNFFVLAGSIVWCFGFILESISDQQKFNFRKNPSNDGLFIQSGCWKYIQHPNYAGEILCWVGLFIVALPFLEGIEYLSIVSPLWIVYLLTQISGIKILQKTAQKKYGHLKTYQVYRKNTNLLIPFIY